MEKYTQESCFLLFLAIFIARGLVGVARTGSIPRVRMKTPDCDASTILVLGC